MASFVCCLCSTTLEKAAERRNLFSESSQSVMPLLFKSIKFYGKDLVRNVFQEDHSKVCRPCFTANFCFERSSLYPNFFVALKIASSIFRSEIAMVNKLRSLGMGQ